MKTVSSPIWYPGGKFWLLRTLMEHIPQGTVEILSPFFGGGAIELNLAVQGVRIHAYDNFEILVNFWQHFLRDGVALLARAKEIARSYDRDTLRAQLVDFDSIIGDVERAAFFYLFNRLSYSGVTFRGWSLYVAPFCVDDFGEPIRIGKNRKTKLFPRTTEFWLEHLGLPLEVGHADFGESLLAHPDIFAYLDPPYPVNDVLYGRSDHDMDHSRLAGILRERDNWILSYNDHPLVHSLYDGFRKMKFSIQNGIQNQQRVSEMLIFSKDL